MASSVQKSEPSKNKYQSKEASLSIAYVFWCLLWAIVLTVSDYTVENSLIPEPWVWPVTLLPAAMTLLVFYRYYLFYSGIDELNRKIQSEALALGFGAGIFAVILFMCLENVGIEAPGTNEMLAIFALSQMAAQIFRTIAYNR